MWRGRENYETAADSHVPHGLADIVESRAVREHGVEEARGARLEHLGDGQAGGVEAVAVVKGGLEGPHGVAEPLVQGQVLGQPAQDGLDQVGVRVDEARHDNLGAAVDLAGPRGEAPCVRALAYGGDGRPVDADVAVSYHLPPRVDGDDCGIVEEGAAPVC